MELQQRTRRFGWRVILCACLLRLLTGDTFLTYLETGRNVRFSAYSEEVFLHLRESPAPWLPRQEKPVFFAQDAALVEMDYDCALRPDLEELLEAPLDWDLTGSAPTVLILHTHATESYTKAGADYEESSEFRTLSEEHNMISIGDRVAQLLTEAGIGVIHDRQLHDYPSYNGSYVHARSVTEGILKAEPSIRLILDLHRDALEKNGSQLALTAEVEGASAAQLMLVVGTNVSRQTHKNWGENLSLALKLQLQLERMYPGLMRPVNLRTERFNQDLSAGALLVEVGAAGNSRDEALRAAEALAAGIIALAKGTGETG